MNITWTLGFPTGDETGSYLTMDLGGTSLRICWIELKGRAGKTLVTEEKFHLPPEIKTGDAGALWSLLAAGGVGLLGIPALTYGIYTDGDRLIVKHDWGTSKVAWKDIDRFEFRGIRGLGLWQRDGEWVLLQQMPGQKRRAAQAINVLEREMEAHIGDQNT